MKRDRDLVQALNNIAKIYRLSTASDGAGGKVRGDYLLVDEIPCRLQTTNESYEVRMPGDTLRETCIMFIEYNNDVRHSDRVEVDGVRYDIMSIMNPSAEPHHYEIGLRRVE